MSKETDNQSSSKEDGHGVPIIEFTEVNLALPGLVCY